MKMKKKKTPKKTRAQLEREIMELKAQMAGVYHFTSANLEKLSTDRLTGSAVIVSLSVLGGRMPCEPFAVRDGLSADTIAALKGDIVRSYDLATLFTPRNAPIV